MNAWVRRGLVTAAMIGFVWSSFSWFEGERELRILCGLFQPGGSVGDVLRVLETGERLRFTTQDSGTVITAWSTSTLGGARCIVDTSDEVVVSSRYAPPVPLERWAAWGAAALLVGLAVFQLLLAAGRPLGRAAWGGRRERLTPAQRVASLVAAGVVLLGAVFLLERVGIVTMFDDPGLVDIGVWILVALFAVSAALNAASKSRAENRFGVAVALALVGLCLIVAWSG